MAKPTLSYLLIGVVVFIGCMVLIYNPLSPESGVYSGIILANNGNLNSEYTAVYSNLSSDKDSVTGLSESLLEPTNLWSLFSTTGLGLVNTLILGLSAIGLLVQIPTYIIHINSVLGSISPIPPIFWWILEMVVTIYVAGMIIRALRGTSEIP